MDKCKISTADALYAEYDWFQKLFPLAMQKSADGFFMPGLKCELIGISRNINLLQTKEAYFVTKVRIDKFYDMFLRISERTVALLLNRSLGRPSRSFNINKLTDLEAEIMTAFNDYVYRIIVQFLEPPPVVNFKRTNFDMTHITFIIKDEEEQAMGKFIISVPDGRMKPNRIVSEGNTFEYDEFYKCPVQVKIEVGKTRFTVKDLKELEAGDMILLEHSNLSSLKLILKDYTNKILIEPNMELEVPLDEEVGNNMGSNTEAANLWDSIEVDMYAEFDPVKISLGDLKKIEEGLVVDVAALYDNKVTLRVENKVIGHGELVIINDRYGVKISEIVDEEEVEEEIQAPAQKAEKTVPVAPGIEDNAQAPETPVPSGPIPPADNANDDEEFDYSDFELEDEDI
ncbi:type III secretion system apparatus protein YscQ/HrcQ [Brachyspira sp. CAG:484]|nr:type III secretion system apparatus protein YscQ/HrcQ [Brachyspira sp. CAG:484]